METFACLEMSWDDEYPDVGEGLEWDLDLELDPWSANSVSTRLFLTDLACLRLFYPKQPVHLAMEQVRLKYTIQALFEDA